MEFKIGADFVDGFINDEPCCDTCKCQTTKNEKINKLIESQTSFEE